MGPGSVLSGLEYGQGDLWSWLAANHVLLGPVIIWIFGAAVGFLVRLLMSAIHNLVAAANPLHSGLALELQTMGSISHNQQMSFEH